MDYHHDVPKHHHVGGSPDIRENSKKTKGVLVYTKIKMINLRNKKNEHVGEKTNMRVFASMDLVRSLGLKLNSSFIIS